MRKLYHKMTQLFTYHSFLVPAIYCICQHWITRILLGTAAAEKTDGNVLWVFVLAQRKVNLVLLQLKLIIQFQIYHINMV